MTVSLTVRNQLDGGGGGGGGEDGGGGENEFDEISRFKIGVAVGGGCNDIIATATATPYGVDQCDGEWKGWER